MMLLLVEAYCISPCWIMNNDVFFFHVSVVGFFVDAITNSPVQTPNQGKTLASTKYFIFLWEWMGPQTFVQILSSKEQKVSHFIINIWKKKNLINHHSQIDKRCTDMCSNKQVTKSMFLKYTSKQAGMEMKEMNKCTFRQHACADFDYWY